MHPQAAGYRFLTPCFLTCLLDCMVLPVVRGRALSRLNATNDSNTVLDCACGVRMDNSCYTEDSISSFPDRLTQLRLQSGVKAKAKPKASAKPRKPAKATVDKAK
jgi:hypothetical protein